MYIQDYFCIILIYNVAYCVIGCTRRHYEVNVMSSLILLTCLWETELSNLYISSILKQIYINVREYRRGNQKWTIQRNRQHIEEPIPSQESERSCIYVLGVNILTLSVIFLLYFRNVPTLWGFLFFLSSHLAFCGKNNVDTCKYNIFTEFIYI